MLRQNFYQEAANLNVNNTYKLQVIIIIKEHTVLKENKQPKYKI